MDPNATQTASSSAAFNLDPQQILTALSKDGIDIALNIVAGLLIFFIGRIAARLIARFARRLMQGAKVDPLLVGFAGNMIYGLLLTLVVMAALEKIGVKTTSFVAIVGAAGLAVGLALQGSLSNFAAGVLMIVFRPFNVGDYIEGGGSAGIVEEIEIFTTQLRSGDNKTIIVPNAKLTGDNIVNYSRKPTRRIDLVFGVGYDADLKKTRAVLLDILTNHEKVLAEPEPVIGVHELADSSVNFVVRPWVKTPDYWTTYFELTEAVKLRFDAEGISIPFPQREIHLHQTA